MPDKPLKPRRDGCSSMAKRIPDEALWAVPELLLPWASKLDPLVSIQDVVKSAH